ncbi:MAG TPA: hypothetical protein VGR62_24595 [Candidatus Binatia bacterium]|jgi:hypothetical protein|nr:hypothetical protein [Candidatus Binatia bacterium]
MSVADDIEDTQEDPLLSLLDAAKAFAARIAEQPMIERILRAFARLPESDREPILGIIERDATWCRIVEQTAETTGITVRPNTQASFYLHVLDPVADPLEPLRRDVDVIRFGMERFVYMLPLLFEPGVHAQWMASAREIVAAADPELRRCAAKLAHEVLSLLGETDAPIEG